MSKQLLGYIEQYPVIKLEECEGPAVCYKQNIFVGPLFFNLSEDEQEFVIYHEIGHITRGEDHAEYIWSLESEIEADRYAAEELGIEAGIRALSKLEGLMKLSDADREDIAVRKNALMSLM